jgi:CIC family chloride channel protein
VISAFETPYFQLTKPWVLVSYAGLGVLMGLVSALFIVSLYGSEKFFETQIKGGYYIQHPLGMLAVGAIMYAMLACFGHYYIEGVGYATIQDVLSGGQFSLYVLVLLFALKLIANVSHLGIRSIRRNLLSSSLSRRNVGRRVRNGSQSYLPFAGHQRC